MLDQRLIENWQRAAEDLGIWVTAPAELRDAAGRPFLCEVLVRDFGSASGTLMVSPRTERRLRQTLRTVPGQPLSIAPARRRSAYDRREHINELEDWGWFGEPGSEPDWYVDRR